MNALAQGTELGYAVHEVPHARINQLPNLPKVLLPRALGSITRLPK